MLKINESITPIVDMLLSKQPNGIHLQLDVGPQKIGINESVKEVIVEEGFSNEKLTQSSSVS